MRINTEKQVVETCQQHPQEDMNPDDTMMSPFYPQGMLASQSSSSLSLSSDGISSDDDDSSSSSRSSSPTTVAVPSSLLIIDQPQTAVMLIDLKEEGAVMTRKATRPLLALKSASSSIKTSIVSMDAKSKPATSWSGVLLVMTFLALLFCYRIKEDLAISATITTQLRLDNSSVCVDGGGFSGFWFTLGRLHSISDPFNKQYYCYSAGCLGVVAALSNYTKDEMLEIALDKQNRWKNGTLDRHDVVGAFLDDLIHGIGSNNNHGSSDSGSSSKLLERVGQEPRFLSSLNIITSQRRRVEGGVVPGLHSSIRTPTSVPELREMLLQTTWIPFAVGASLFYKDHMDGAFTIAQHPHCARRVGLALDFDLLMNAVNVNLAGNKAEKFWMSGLEYGL